MKTGSPVRLIIKKTMMDTTKEYQRHLQEPLYHIAKQDSSFTVAERKDMETPATLAGVSFQRARGGLFLNVDFVGPKELVGTRGHGDRLLCGIQILLVVDRDHWDVTH